MSGYPCPVCEAARPEPCQDAVENATTAVLVADRRPSPLRRALEANGEAVVDVPFLVAQPGWAMALVNARRHKALGCADPSECEDCWNALSVLQVDAYFWATREAALAGS